MKKQTSLYLSDIDREKAEELLKIYNLSSLGKLIRVLIQAEFEKQKYIKNER